MLFSLSDYFKIKIYNQHINGHAQYITVKPGSILYVTHQLDQK